MQGYPHRICTREYYDDMEIELQERVKIALPRGFDDSVTCANPPSRNVGLCPGDTGNTCASEDEGRMVMFGVAQGDLLECGNRFPAIYGIIDSKETLPFIWKEVFGEEFKRFVRPRYDRYWY